MTVLSLLLEHWDYRHVPPSPVSASPVIEMSSAFMSCRHVYKDQNPDKPQAAVTTDWAMDPIPSLDVKFTVLKLNCT